MSEALNYQLQRAGVSCMALVSWCACHEGRKDNCERCSLDGPETCDAQLVKILVDKVVNAVGHVDEALAQRDYWKGVVDRLTAVVMISESTRTTTQKRRLV